MRAFAISDIHGHLEHFDQLLTLIELSKSDKLFLLGDYIDRGKKSKGVLDRIIELQTDGYNIKCIRGNHEQMLLDAFQNDVLLNFWLRNGGQQTLESFGISQIEDLPELYLNFIHELPHFIEFENYILVHAGINMLAESPLEDLESMLWLRGWEKKFERNWIGDRVVIHGHTPQPEKFLKSRANKGRVIGIDNGVYFNQSEFGGLCAFELLSKEIKIFKK